MFDTLNTVCSPTAGAAAVVLQRLTILVQIYQSASIFAAGRLCGCKYFHQKSSASCAAAAAAVILLDTTPAGIPPTCLTISP
jgi:hypothetical protein